MNMKIRRYSELIKIDSYEDRFEYLKLGGSVGEATFGYDRYLNQVFYASKEWKKARRDIIIRDDGCDLGDKGRPIKKYIIVHHMNAITPEQIERRDPALFDPEYLICVSEMTHKAIHYGDSDLLVKTVPDRKPNDTCPWRKAQ